MDVSTEWLEADGRGSFLVAFPDPATGGLPFEVVTPELRAGIVALAERELLIRIKTMLGDEVRPARAPT